MKKNFIYFFFNATHAGCRIRCHNIHPIIIVIIPIEFVRHDMLTTGSSNKQNLSFSSLPRTPLHLHRLNFIDDSCRFHYYVAHDLLYISLMVPKKKFRSTIGRHIWLIFHAVTYMKYI